MAVGPAAAARRALARGAAGALALALACAAGGGKMYINTVGYTPDAPKLATVEHKWCDAQSDFKVMRAGAPADDAPVLSGKLTPIPGAKDMCRADFSELRTPGNYTLVAVDLASSSPFEVSPAAVNRVFRMAMEGFWLARCGMDVPVLPRSADIVTTSYTGRPFAHANCHREDGWVDAKHTHEHVPESENGGERYKNGTGGWHDAGDYGKYSVNTGFTLGVLMFGWEHWGERIGCADLGLRGALEAAAHGAHGHAHSPAPSELSSGSRLPDYLDETRWGMAWLLKMQKDDGTVYHKLTPKGFASFGDVPEADPSRRYYSPWSTSATGNVASTGAQCARVFRSHDSKLADACLAAAKRAWTALEAHPEEVKPDLSAFGTGTYVMFENPEWDDGIRIWAAMELYETTGDQKYLHAGEALIRKLNRPAAECGSMPQPSGCKVADQLDWDEQRNLGMLRYATLSSSKNRDEQLYREVVESFRVVTSGMVDRQRRDAYADTLAGFTKWGVNGEAARQTLVLHAAEKVLGSNRTLVDAQFNQLSHLLGLNMYGRSYVTHLGHEPPLHPHHRPSMVYKDPWPGYLVGGPNSGWKDAWLAFRSNEVAINWNAGLAYAAARWFTCDAGKYAGSGGASAHPAQLAARRPTEEPPAAGGEGGGHRRRHRHEDEGSAREEEDDHARRERHERHRRHDEANEPPGAADAHDNEAGGGRSKRDLKREARHARHHRGED